MKLFILTVCDQCHALCKPFPLQP